MFADMDFWFPDLNTPAPEHDDQGDDQNNAEDPNMTGTSRYRECMDEQCLCQVIKKIKNLHVYKKCIL
jgi:hypothetical protein